MTAVGGINGGRPRVLFVCVKNGGKSQMAAGIMRHAVGEAVDIDSAGTRPGDGVKPGVRALVERMGHRHAAPALNPRRAPQDCPE